MAEDKIKFVVESNQNPLQGFSESLSPSPLLFPAKPVSVRDEYDDIEKALIAYNQTSDNGEKYLSVECGSLFGDGSLLSEKNFVILMDSDGSKGFSHLWEPMSTEEDINQYSDKMKDFLLSPEYQDVWNKVQGFVNHDEMFTQKTFFIQFTDTPKDESYVAVQVDEPGQNIDCLFYNKDMLLLYNEKMPFNGESLNSDMFHEVFYGTLMQEKGIPSSSLVAVDNEKFREYSKEAYQHDVADNKLKLNHDMLDGLSELGWKVSFDNSARPKEYAVAVSRDDTKSNVMFFCKGPENFWEQVRDRAKAVSESDLPNAVDQEELSNKFKELSRYANKCMEDEGSINAVLWRNIDTAKNMSVKDMTAEEHSEPEQSSPEQN